MLDVEDFDFDNREPLIPESLRKILVKFERSLLFLLFLAGFALCYHTVLFIPYALPDDFVAMAASSSAMNSWNPFGPVGDRSVVTLLKQLSFLPVRTVADIRYVRALGVIGIALLALLVHRALVDSGWGRGASFFALIIAFTTPPFQVYAAYAAAASCLFSGAISAMAAWILARSLAVDLKGRPLRRYGIVGCAVILLAVALNTYPPTAMFFWVIAAIVFLKPETSLPDVTRRVGLFACVHAAAALLSAAVSGPLPATPPSDLFSLDKLLWFLRDPLLNALNLFAIEPSVWLGSFVGVLLLVGMLLYFHGDDWSRLGKLSMAIAILFLVSLPILMTPKWSPYRVQPALFCLVVIYAFFALEGYIQLLRRFTAVVPTAVILFLPALTSCFLASHNVWVNFVLPQAKELQWMRNQVNTKSLSTARSIYVIGSSWRDSIAPTLKYDEFGVPFSAAAYALKPAVDGVLRETRPEKARISVEVASDDGSANPPPGALVVDMRGIRTLKYSELE